MNRSPSRKSPVKKNRSPRRRSPAKKSKSPRRRSPVKKNKSPRRKSPVRKNKSPRRKLPAKKNRSPRRKSPAKKNSRSPNRKSRKYRNMLKGGVGTPIHQLEERIILSNDQIESRIEKLELDEFSGNPRRMQEILRLFEELQFTGFKINIYKNIIELIENEEEFRRKWGTKTDTLQRLLDISAIGRVSSVGDKDSANLYQNLSRPKYDFVSPENLSECPCVYVSEPKRLSSAPERGVCLPYYDSSGKNKFDFGRPGNFEPGLSDSYKLSKLTEAKDRRDVYLKHEDHRLVSKFVEKKAILEDHTYVWARDSINIRTAFNGGIEKPSAKTSPHSIEIHVTTHNRAVLDKHKFFTHVTLVIRRDNPTDIEEYHLGTKVYKDNGLDYCSPVIFWAKAGTTTHPNHVTLTDKENLKYLFPFENNAASLLRKFYDWANELCPSFFLQQTGTGSVITYDISQSVYPRLPVNIPLYTGNAIIPGSVQLLPATPPVAVLAALPSAGSKSGGGSKKSKSKGKGVPVAVLAAPPVPSAGSKSGGGSKKNKGKGVPVAVLAAPPVPSSGSKGGGGSKKSKGAPVAAVVDSPEDLRNLLRKEVENNISYNYLVNRLIFLNLNREKILKIKRLINRIKNTYTKKTEGLESFRYIDIINEIIFGFLNVSKDEQGEDILEYLITADQKIFDAEIEYTLNDMKKS